jgi:four helix bundle protein
MESRSKIKSFTDLVAWKEGHKLVLQIYKLTDTFPKKELFSLTNQMRRSCISITSNISEGFSRRTKKDKVQFYYMAIGSMTELQNQLLISKDLGYMSKTDFMMVANQSVDVHKLLNGMIKSAKSIEYV